MSHLRRILPWHRQRRILPRVGRSCRIIFATTAFLCALPQARGLEGCSTLSLVEVSAALDPVTGLTVQGGNTGNPHVGGCAFKSGEGSILGANASDDPAGCAKVMGIVEQQKPPAVAVTGVGDRALLRSEAGTTQLIVAGATRCVALTLKRESHLAELDAQHVLTVLAGESLSRDWSGPPRNYWDEPASQPHPLADERVRSYQQLQNSQDLLVLIALGNLYFRMNDYESARLYQRRAIDVAPKRADLYFELGLIDGQAARQFLVMTAVKQKSGVSQEPPVCITPEPSALKSADQAIDDLQKALAIDSGFFPAVVSLPAAYRQRADLHCGDPTARAADLSRAEEWQRKSNEMMSARAFSVVPINTPSWQSVTPFGMPPLLSSGGANQNAANSNTVEVAPGVSQGLLISQAPPVYPPLARQARIQGTVVIHAVIGKDGAIQELKLVTGHPMLAPAAMEAVKQWRYKPYVLNGEPLEVQTTINVNFALTDK